MKRCDAIEKAAQGLLLLYSAADFICDADQVKDE